jgi:hypothetical protein
MGFEEEAEKTAKHIVSSLDSHFVTDAIAAAWIKTAMIQAYHTARAEVFREEMRFVQEKHPSMNDEKVTNRVERRRMAREKAK